MYQTMVHRSCGQVVVCSTTPLSRLAKGRHDLCQDTFSQRKGIGGIKNVRNYIMMRSYPTTPHKGYHFNDGRSTDRFFEGWYWRVTLPGDSKSFALIYSIEDPKGGAVFSGVGAQVMGPDDGYLLQYSKDVSSFWADRSQLALGACFSGLESSVTHKGMLPKGVFNDCVQYGFQASSTWHQGCIRASETGASGDLTSTVDSCRWEFSITPKTGWGDLSGRQKSTAGWLSTLPIFEPHWQVLMSHGEADGWIEWGGTRYTFQGAPAYAEKNWGGGFPHRWVWVQCNTFEGSPGTSLTAVGAERGLLQFPGLKENVGLIGVHHKGQFYELNIKDSAIRWDVSPWGRWHIEGSSAELEATVDAVCGDSDGTPLRAPTADKGLAPFCKDSFGGVVHLRVWKNGDRQKGKDPIIDLHSNGKSGAVEVGGGPWWSDWAVEAQMSEPVRQLLQIPIDIDFIADTFLPEQFRPPGY